MVEIVDSECVVLLAVVLTEARSSFVVEVDVLARAGSYFGRWITLESPYEMSLRSSVVPEVHSSHSL
jgi:hypothetical protein